MFEQAKRAIMSNGVIARPPVLHGVTPRPLLLICLVIIAIAFLVWWLYLSALAFSATRQLQLSNSALLPQPQAQHSVIVAPVVAPIDQQPQATTQSDQTKTSVRINDDTIALPTSGTLHKTIHSDDGNSSVDISVNATSSGASDTVSSTNIQLRSQTQTNISNESEPD